MLGLGFSEILCIVIIGVIILGPEHTPKAARKIGQWLAKMRSATASLNDAIAQDETLSSLQKDVRDVQKTVRDIGKHVDPQKLLHNVNSELDDIHHSLKNEAFQDFHQSAPSQALHAQADSSATIIADNATAQDNAAAHIESEPPAASTATRLFDHIERFYDEKRGMRTFRLSNPILVPSHIARATSRFSYVLEKPQEITAVCLSIRLRPPLAGRAVEKHRRLPSPRKSTVACFHVFSLNKPQKH